MVFHRDLPFEQVSYVRKIVRHYVIMYAPEGHEACHHVDLFEAETLHM